MNPYEVLGVAKDASAADVKAAYRVAASRAHPDREGGSTERMAQVNEANAILTDPARRARYDKTGEVDQPPTIEREAMTMLAQFFTQGLEQDRIGVLTFASRAVTKLRAKLVVDRDEARHRATKLEAKRKTVRTKGDAPNIVHGLIDSQVAALRKAADDMDHALQITEVVTKLLASYDEDLPLDVGADSIYARLMAAGQPEPPRRAFRSFDQFDPF